MRKYRNAPSFLSHIVPQKKKVGTNCIFFGEEKVGDDHRLHRVVALLFRDVYSLANICKEGGGIKTEPLEKSIKLWAVLGKKYGLVQCFPNVFKQNLLQHFAFGYKNDCPKCNAIHHRVHAQTTCGSSVLVYVRYG